MTGQPERTALYRIRGETETLLYVGITNSIPFRWNGHQAVQPWWDELRSLTVEWHATRDEAEAAEKAAILAEQPKYNVTYLKPTRGRKRQGGHPEAELIDWESFMFEPQPDDDDLVDIGDVARMTRISSTSTAKAALRRTGGPQGFTLGSQQHLVFRKGEIRRWIAAVEASQKKPRAVPAPSAAARETPRDKRRARMRAVLPGLEPLFDVAAEAS